jgi:hypothetical protein
VTSARASWTDERLDDLNERVSDMGRRMDAGFERVDQDLRALRSETNARFDALHRTLLQVGGGLIATFLAGFATLLLAQV